MPHRPNTLENFLLKPYFWRRPSQVVRRVGHALAPPRGQTIVRLPWGLEIECSSTDMIGRSLIRTGVFEMATTEALARLVDPGDLVLDVGANIGYMTSVLARFAGPAGHVVAYEPNPTVYEHLVRNVQRWQRPDLPPIDVRAVAASESRGAAQLAIPEGGHEWATLGTEPTARAAAGSHVILSVPTIRLDDDLGEASVGVMKLDVEDHEPKVLEGARDSLAQRRIRDVVFEDHGSYPSETTDVLEAYGYAVFDLTQRTRGITLHPPQARIDAPSWSAPMRVATVNPDRAQRRTSRPGWVALGGSIRRHRGWLWHR